MKAYHYDKETKEHIRTTLAARSPKEDYWAEEEIERKQYDEEGNESTVMTVDEDGNEVPVIDIKRTKHEVWKPFFNSTLIELPNEELADDHAWVFDTDNQEWVQTLDKRGNEYWTQIDGVTTKATITELGEDLPEGAFATEPEPTQEELDAIQAEEAAQAKAIKYATWDEETTVIFAETPSALATEFLEHVTPLQNFRRSRLPYHYISWLENKVSNPTPEAQVVIDKLKAAALKVLQS